MASPLIISPLKRVASSTASWLRWSVRGEVHEGGGTWRTWDLPVPVAPMMAMSGSRGSSRVMLVDEMALWSERNIDSDHLSYKSYKKYMYTLDVLVIFDM